MHILFTWFKGLRTVQRKKKVYEQLQWQRFLLRTGIQATALVLDMVEEGYPFQNYVQVRIWVMVKLKGRIIYRHIQTLLQKQQLPAIGATIHIRYCPDDLSRVLVM